MITHGDWGTMERTIRRRFGWWPFRVLGGAALFGCGVVLLCDLVMWFLVSGYDPVGQTISELAAGPHHGVQDTGIVLFTLGILALTAGLTLRGRAGKLAWFVRGAFLRLAVDVAMIALWNEYGDGEPGGPVIHRYLVSALYALTAFCLWFGTSVEPVRGRSLAKVGKAAAIGWLIAAPLFLVIPDAVDGLYERSLALIMVGAVAIAAWQLFERPKEE